MWVERLWSGRWSATYVHYEPNLQFLLMAKFLLPLSVVVTLCMCCHPCPYSTENTFTDVPQCHKMERKWFQNNCVRVASAGYFADFFCKRYRTAENFRGRKLSRISRFCGYLWKFSLWNLGRGIDWCSKSEQSAKVFLTESYFSPICESFLPRKFLAIRYHVLHLLLTPKL